MNKVSLKDVCTKITDGAHKTPTYVEEGVPFLRVTDIRKDSIIWKDTKKIPKAEHEDLKRRCNPQIGDILYSKNGTIGIAREIDWENEFSIFVSLALLKPKKNLISPTYLKHFLNSEYAIRQATRHSKTGTVTNLHLTEIKKIQIPLPPLPIQKRIADLLDKADALRQKDRELLEQYDRLAESVFLEMFGDPKSNPKGWEKQQFEYFASFDTQMTTDFEKYANYPHIGIGNIEKDSGKLIDYQLVKDENLISGKYIFGPEHIIYSKIRPNLNKVALPEFSGLCSADSYPVLVNKKTTNRLFLASLMRSNAFIEFILGHSSRTNIPKANKAQIKLFKGIAPPLILQEKFAQIIQNIENQKKIVNQQLTQSESLFESLLQKAFRGELFQEHVDQETMSW